MTQTEIVQFAGIDLATGVHIRYAEAGDAPGTPIILLHGYSDSWYSYSRIIPGLATVAKVYALDQRGHGDSDKPATGYMMPDFAADVVAFMDALQIPRAVVVGHSMGSLIAQQLARTAPERVAHLVLVGAAANFNNPVVTELQQAVESFADPVSEEFIWEFQTSTVHTPLPDDFLDQVIVESSKLPALVWRGAMEGMLAADQSPYLGEIRMPTLIIWGARDTIFFWSDQQQLLAGLPNASIKVYSDAGHALHWEEPERFTADLIDFVL